MSRLEARARQLLRAYPPDYRADRGEEILGTLLDASPPDRTWPAPRDAWSMVTGGLRVRSGRNRQYPLATNLRLALVLAAALGLAANPMYRWLWWVNGATPSRAAYPAYAVCAVLVGATVIAPWFARRSVTVPLGLLAAFALGLIALYDGHYRFWVAWYVAPALVLAAVVAKEPARPPRRWLWIPAAAFLATTLLFFVQSLVDFSPPLSSIVGIAGTVLVDGLGIAVLLWLAVDARPAIGVAIFLEGFYGLPGFGFALREGWDTPGLSSRELLLPLAVGCLAVVLLRSKTPQNQAASPASDRVIPGG